MRILVSVVLLLTVHRFSLPVEGQCTGAADVIIAVPGSSSMPDSEFATFENNIIELLTYFTISLDDFNVGLVLYGENAIPVLYPQPYRPREQVNTRVTLLSQRYTHAQALGQNNDVAEALNAVQQMFVSGDPLFGSNVLRPSARKIAIILTYGPTPDVGVQAVIAAAANLQTVAVVYATTSGGINEDFQHIGTDFCRLFSMGSYNASLHVAVPYITSGVCSEVDPGVTVVSGNCYPQAYGQEQVEDVSCQIPNFQFQEDPNNCAYYYHCPSYAGVPIRVSCADNTLWDPSINSCNFLTSSSCYDPFLTCPASPPALHPYTPDCTKYINCDSDMVPHLQSCPPGHFFQEIGQFCLLGTCP